MSTEGPFRLKWRYGNHICLSKEIYTDKAEAFWTMIWWNSVAPRDYQVVPDRSISGAERENAYQCDNSSGRPTPAKMCHSLFSPPE